MHRSLGLLALGVVALLALMAATPLLTPPPDLRPASVAGQFDAKRAVARLADALGDQRPHPTDTPANDRVRERIVAQLRGLGLDPVVRDQVACNELYKARGVSCARVRNVIAVIGPRTGKAVLLNAHYDSSPVGPGAGDAGIGVATLLEVAANLRNQRLGRPVMLLFNEGEELGLIGARAFLADPLSRSVGSLVNHEARGVRGPVNMFETSRPNAPAIAVFGKAVERPVANSLSVDVYRLMPNYTDVNTFAERGWLTLNLAPVGNETRYHSAGDNLAALDLATLQHMGDQTLALATELANGGGAQPGGERIFMDFAGRGLLAMPLTLGALLLGGLMLSFAILWVRRGNPGRSIAVVIAAVLAGTALAWACVMIVGLLRPGMFWRAYPIWAHLAVYASAILAAVALVRTLGRRLDVRQLRAACWLHFLVAGAGIGVAAPGGIIYFLLPPLVILAGAAAARVWPPAERVAALAAIVLLYLTWGAMLGLLQELLNQGPLWLFAPFGALIFVPAAIEAKPLIDALSRRIAIAVPAAAALALWAAATAAPAYSADKQQRFTIEHVTDAAGGKAYWSVLNDRAPLPAAYRHAGEWRWTKLAHSDRKRWLAPAPRQTSATPAIDLVSALRHGRERRVTVRLRPQGASRVTLIAPKDAQIRAAGVAGFIRPIDAAADNGRYSIDCFGRSCDGLELSIVIGKLAPVEFTIVGMRPGLPASAAPLIAARPRFARPQYAPDQTLVLSKIRL